MRISRVACMMFLASILMGAVLLSLANDWPLSINPAERHEYDVRVLVHLNDDLKPAIIKSMLSELPFVTGLQFDVWVGDNTTGGITDAKGRISTWLKEFTDYRIVIQCDYFFERAYGYYERPFWKFNETQTLSQQWYTDWYGNLSEVLNEYPNVELMVGYNEPYNHFQTKEMTQIIMRREYLTWKNLSSIPFTVKFSMPYLMWAERWDFPLNASIEEDYAPFWGNYSDYVGFDLWADSHPPHLGGNDESAALHRIKESIELAKNYSAKLNKPIFVGEYPAWNTTALKYISDHVAQAPNIGQVYQLWYWSGEEEMHQDAWTYALFNVDRKTIQVSRAEPEWTVFNKILNPN